MTIDTTKTRLLDAGRHVFAEHGPEKARVREICSLAQANVAAVNYHFGSKGRFYLTVLSDNMRQALERHPLDAGVDDESSPEERLKAFVHGLLEHFLAEDGDEVSAKLGKLVIQEMFTPSEHFEEIIESHLRPVNKELRAIVRELLPNASSDVVTRCTGSILAQFALFRFDPRVREALGKEFILREDSFHLIAESIIEFSLGGIHRLRSIHS